jgi:hypothetical protein
MVNKVLPNGKTSADVAVKCERVPEYQRFAEQFVDLIVDPK